MTRRFPVRRRSVGVAALLLITGAGCGIGEERDARSQHHDDVPFELLDPEAPALVPDPAGLPVTICLLSESALRPVPRRMDPEASLTAIVRSLTDDVTDAEAAEGLRTALNPEVLIHSASVRRGSAVVDFSEAPRLGGQDRILGIAQIVCTLARQPGVGQVSFTVAGAPVQVPTADGSLTSEPVTLDDYVSTAAPTSPGTSEAATPDASSADSS